MRNDLYVSFEEFDFQNDFVVNLDRILPNGSSEAGGYIRITQGEDDVLNISIINMAGDCLGDISAPLSEMIGGE
jgi:hypothetical protein